jgi:adenylate cyclase
MRIAIATTPGTAPIFAEELPPQVILGRQDEHAGDPKPIALRRSTSSGTTPKLVIVASKEVGLASRKQLLVEQCGSDEVRLVNLSTDIAVGFVEGAPLTAGQERIGKLPLTLALAGFEIRLLKSGAADDELFETLDAVTMRPGASLATPTMQGLATAKLPSMHSSYRGKEYEELLDRLALIVRALERAAASDQFLPEMAKAAEEAVELDKVVVLLREGNEWIVAADTGRDPAGSPNWRPPGILLSRMAERKRTMFRKSGEVEFTAVKGPVVASMVAAPILNDEGEVIGAVYGHRYAPGQSIGRVDAKLVEILATGTAAALARIDQETKAIKAQVLFEQFVTPKIARHITADAHVLAGREAEASLLFCDISGFSRVTEKLTPQQTIAWINDVLELLSQCVLAEEGTLVDYVGDELFAMFGAPIWQADHAVRACRAGVNMISALTTLNDKWRGQLQEDMDVGIGVNSGRVLVGNVGSATKLKYGAHGTHVNIGSRVQSATRYFRARFLATEATVHAIGPEFVRRRIGQVRVKNIAQPIYLHELLRTPPAGWDDLKRQYEAALDAWEKGDAEQAMRGFSRLAAEYPHDGPTMAMLTRAMEAWTFHRPPEVVWQLPGK